MRLENRAGRVFIVGIGEDGILGLSGRAKEIVRGARVLAGGKRHLDLVMGFSNPQKVIKIGADIKKVIDEIKEELDKGEDVVVLNSGDPLFYGFAKRAFEEIGRERCEVIPSVSSLQLAFAKIKESWEDAKLLSIHSAKVGLEELIWDIIESEKIFILTSGKDDPKNIANFLLENGIEVERFWVLENLGGEDERILELKLDKVMEYDFSPLNVVIIKKRKEPRKYEFGLSEDRFFRKGGLITKGEVRAIALSKLSVFDGAVIWDIGGGSGSVSIECARLARKAKIYCIEKRQDILEFIRENIRKFKTYNVEIVYGSAPEILSALPDPHSAFIGGGGEKIEEIFEECLSRKTLRSIAATFVVPSHFVRALNFLEGKGIKYEAFFINILKLKKVDRFDMFDAHSTVFLLHAKPNE